MNSDISAAGANVMSQKPLLTGVEDIPAWSKENNRSVLRKIGIVKPPRPLVTSTKLFLLILESGDAQQKRIMAKSRRFLKTNTSVC